MHVKVTSLNICFPFPVLVTSDFASFIYTTFKSDLSRNVYYWKREGGRERGGRGGEEENIKKEKKKQPIVLIEILCSAQYLYQGDTVNNVTTARKRVRYPRAQRIDFRGIGHGAVTLRYTHDGIAVEIANSQGEKKADRCTDDQSGSQSGVRRERTS